VSSNTGILRVFGGFIAEVTVREQHVDDLTITTHPVERGAPITDHAFRMPALLTIEAGWSAAGAYEQANPLTADTKPRSNFQKLTDAYNQILPVVAAVGGPNAVGTLSTAYNTIALGNALTSQSSTQNLNDLYGQIAPVIDQFSPEASQALAGIVATIAATQDQQTGIEDGAKPLRDLYDKLIQLQRSAELISVQTGKRAYDNMLIRSIRTQTDQSSENILMITAQLQEVLLVDTFQTTMPATARRADPAASGGVTQKGVKSAVSYSGPIPTYA
jgi:hypothetical protein